MGDIRRNYLFTHCALRLAPVQLRESFAGLRRPLQRPTARHWEKKHTDK